MNKKTFGFDPFIDHKKYKSINIIKDINSFDVIIFLSKGKIYENLFKKIKSKKQKLFLIHFITIKIKFFNST